MVKSQIAFLVTAIGALESIAQKYIKPRKSWPAILTHIITQRDHRRQSHLEAWAMDVEIVFGNHIHAVEEDSFHHILPAPQG